MLLHRREDSLSSEILRLCRYNERFDKNCELYLSAFKANVDVISHCIQVNKDQRKITVCVKQDVCAPWPLNSCNEAGKFSQSVRY